MISRNGKTVTRKFNNKKYFLKTTLKTKTMANSAKKAAKNKGLLARVTKNKRKGYDVWIRGGMYV